MVSGQFFRFLGWLQESEALDTQHSVHPVQLSASRVVGVWRFKTLQQGGMLVGYYARPVDCRMG